MSDKHEFRYLFTVRQQFGQEPAVDSFYELQVPSGLTGDHAQVMTKLNENFCKKEITADSSALNGMEMRLRFNSDMYQKVLLVRTAGEIDADNLDCLIKMKHQEGQLMDFLKDAEL